MIRTVAALFGVLAFVTCLSMGQGRLNRDPLVSFVDVACILTLPTTAFLASKLCRWFPVFTVFGCLGMVPLVTHWWSIAIPNAWVSNVQVTWLIACCSVSMLASAFLCRYAAFRGSQFWDRGKSGEPLCRHCGYNLTGNVSGICPECGKAIESPIETTP
ncbi:hypothetical protein B7486_11770 [cyanobacterium TDX16]|nr:hypothetical protein B7486_11770 [cyanobacterium TDX16]